MPGDLSQRTGRKRGTAGDLFHWNWNKVRLGIYLIEILK